MNVYYAFEFCPQNSLREVLDQRLEPQVARFYFCGIVAGLAFLHSLDIIHRDIKPENIFIGPSGYPVIGDFGTARRMQDDFVQLKKEDGIIKIAPPVAYYDWDEIGTYVYNAPEQYTKTDGLIFGPSVDWWAAGVVLYEMLTQKFPFYSKDARTLREMVKQGRFRWPDDLRVGKTAKALVAALLAVDPMKRLGTYDAQEVMDYPWFRNVDWAKIQSRQYPSPRRKNGYPGPGERWHELALPKQKNVPGLRVAEPPIELRYDRRFKVKQW
ncbi:kinase-like protein [Gymnopus androsaceus JB14]|uniref:Kinase-like protein n=1 Tax=Gymnopus androsaceus JB14 TaxID=1447944 RepID=A0A6A4HLV3_9AGAR|nr:kinase-like protein [Gymnopus androsaceus JB14]